MIAETRASGQDNRGASVRFQYEARNCNPDKWTLFKARLANSVLPIKNGSLAVLPVTVERPHNVLEFTLNGEGMPAGAVDEIVHGLCATTMPDGTLNRITPARV